MLSKKIKKDAKILNEIFEIENNLKSYNKIENLVLINSLLFPIISTTLIFLIFNDFLREKDIVFLVSIGFMFQIAVFSFLNSISFSIINSLIKRKYIKKNIIGSKVLSFKYIVRGKKVEKVKKLYDLLSEEGKKNIYCINQDEKQRNNVEEIEKKCLHFQILDMKKDVFINYWNTSFTQDIKELNISEEGFIISKINNILNDITESEFNLYKDEIIKITETLSSKKDQLVIFKKIEELKEKYDEETIVNEINSIKNKVTKSTQEKTNKVLKSI